MELELDIIKLKAQEELQDQIKAIKKMYSVSAKRSALRELAFNISHLTRNKLGFTVGYDFMDKVVITPLNLASLVLLEEGVLIKNQLHDTGHIIINEKDYYYRSPEKFGYIGEHKKHDPIRTFGLVRIRGNSEIHELHRLFYSDQKKDLKYFWVKNQKTEEFSVQKKSNIIKIQP